MHQIRSSIFSQVDYSHNLEKNQLLQPKFPLPSTQTTFLQSRFLGDLIDGHYSIRRSYLYKNPIRLVHLYSPITNRRSI